MATSSDRPALILDLDGTLVDVAARDYAVYRDLLVEDGLAPLPFARYWPLRRERLPLPELLALSGPAAAADVPGFVTRRAARYESAAYLGLDALLPGVVETLGSLRARYRCVLITSRSNEDGTLGQLAALGLAPHLSAVFVTGGDKGDALRAAGAVVMVVGDTEHDIALARGHGRPSFAVTTGMRSRGFLAGCGPTYLADRLSELIPVLAEGAAAC